jgi:hypothetical protein
MLIEANAVPRIVEVDAPAHVICSFLGASGAQDAL